jgi:hypothetical protein
MENEIYILMSFRLSPSRKFQESGRRFWFRSFDRVLNYLKFAGKPVEGKENTFYDEPCETRWNYIVVEKVPEGPMSIAKVMGWWEGIHKDGKLVEIVQLKESPIVNSENIFNFTDLG